MFEIYAAVSEGLCDCIKPLLPNLMTNVFPYGIENQNMDVKEAALKACSYFSQYLQPEIVDYHGKILTAMLRELEKDLKQDMLQSMLVAIDLFVENMEEHQIKDYIDLLVNRLVTTVNLPEENCPYDIRNQSISTLGSVIISGQKYMKNYFEPVFQALSNCFFSSKESLVELKGTCLSNLGKLVSSTCSDNVALYKEKFSPILHHVVTTKYDKADYTFIEGLFEFFYNSAAVLGEGFSEVFPPILENIYNMANAISSNECTKKEGELDMDSDIEDDDEDDTMLNMNIHFINAKSCAIRTLGEFCKSCPKSFQQNFNETNEIIDYT